VEYFNFLFVYFAKEEELILGRKSETLSQRVLYGLVAEVHNKNSKKKGLYLSNTVLLTLRS